MAAPAHASPQRKVATSICEQGDPKDDHGAVTVRAADNVEFEAFICSTAALVNVILTDPDGNQHKLLTQAGASHAKVTVAPLMPGPNILLWSYTFASDPWQDRTDVNVNGVNQFRSKNAGSKPVDRDFIHIVVTP